MMTKQEELDQLLAEIEVMKAELAELQAEAKTEAKKQSKKRTKSARRAASRPIHHPESDLRSERYGFGGPTPVNVRVRVEVTPVVTRQYNPMDRPTRDRMPKKVQVRVYNDAKQQEGDAMVMLERDADQLMMDLPFGWSITARPCK